MGFVKGRVKGYVKNRVGIYVPTDFDKPIAAGDSPAPPAPVPTPWLDLYNAPSTMSPVACLYAGGGFETLAGSDVAAATCAWGSGHNASKAANRPEYNSTTGRWEFRIAQTESLLWDWSSAAASGVYTVVVGVVNGAVQMDDEFYVDWATGRLAVKKHHATGLVGYYDGAASPGSQAATTGAQYLTYVLRATGSGGGIIRRSGAVLDTATSYAEHALGGACVVGARNDDADHHGNFDLKFLAVYSGYDATDVTAIEAVAASIMGL